jgi:CHAD domain-containing protein
MKSDAHWNDALPVSDNVAHTLPVLAKKWFAAGEKGLQPGRTWDEMHQFRLLTKRFRYSLEIFLPLYGPTLTKRIEQLRKLQNFLGDINDCITAQTLLGLDDTDGSLHRALSEKAERRTSELREYWAAHFAGGGPVEKWTTYLSKYAGRTRRLSGGI